MAATTPNNAMKAGNRIDCDIAVANGSCRKAGRFATSDFPGAGAPAGTAGNSAVMRADMKAAMLALPSTEPT